MPTNCQITVVIKTRKHNKKNKEPRNKPGLHKASHPRCLEETMKTPVQLNQ